MNFGKKREVWIGLSALLLGGLLFLVPPHHQREVHAAEAADPATQPEVRRTIRPPVLLSLDSSHAVHSGRFVPGTEGDIVRFTAPATGRYFCFETLSAHDGRPYAAIAELDLLDPAGKSIERGRWKVVYADSEEIDRENGSAENAVDGNPATFWHTQWGSGAPNHPHHLVLDLGQSVVLGGFRYVPRPGSGMVGGRIEGFRIYVGDDLVVEHTRNTSLPEKCYVFSYFTGVGEDGLHVASSLNGYRWDAMFHGRSFLRPNLGELGLMRDPCLIRDREGTFHLVWTAAWAGNAIGYASSKDLIHWSEQRALPVMTNEPGTANCWAPELFWNAEKNEFLIFWASTVTNASEAGDTAPVRRGRNRLYATSTKDFQTFSPTRVLYDPGFPVLDATLVPAKGRYYLVFKDETVHRLRIAAADHPDGPFGRPGPAFGPFGVEGPAVVAVRDQFLVAFHFIAVNRFGAVKSSDLEHWEDISSGMTLPAGGRQGTMVELPGTVLQPLVDAGRLELGAASEVSDLGIGDWIWTTNVTDKQSCRLWKSFDIPRNAQVVRAELRMTADNGYTAYLDGREIGRGGDASCITEYDVTWMLSPGHHVLAVEAFNETMDAGVTAGLRVRFASGRSLEILSDPSWLVADGAARSWRTSKQAKRSWSAAQIVGYAGKAWWQYPTKVIQSPPLRPPVPYFWQRTWVLVLLLLACLAILAICVRLGLRVALQARAQRLVERERARIAREIHDDLGAGLTQLTLLGELALRETPREVAARSRLNDLCGKARQLLKSMDEIVWSVNSRRDTLQDFAAFVSEQTQEFLGTTPIRCRLEVADELPSVPLDLPKRRNLMLAVKEAVHNAARHSDASELTLRVRIVDENLEVVVEDNGKGFDPGAVPVERNGLHNMRQRLLDIAGTCTVTSRPGYGSRVVFVLPLAAAKLRHRWFSPLAGPAMPEPKLKPVESEE